MKSQNGLTDLLDSTLSMLELYTDQDSANDDSDAPLTSLLKQCELRCEAIENAPVEPLRTIHHFACTGGTILSRSISAQPNTVLLSEADPLSPLENNTVRFMPSNVTGLARAGVRAISDEIAIDTFLASLEALYRNMTLIGRHLVLRDHPHSHFCTEISPASRPSMRSLLARKFTLRSIVTVRHPLDSYLSLVNMGWVHFRPQTLEEYANRYQLFLDEHADKKIFLYENFTADPDGVLIEMTEELALPYVSNWQDLLFIIKLSGDSGRKGNSIGDRPRRAIPEKVRSETHQNAAYDALCDRLGYNPDPSLPPLM